MPVCREEGRRILPLGQENPHEGAVMVKSNTVANLLMLGNKMRLSDAQKMGF